MAKKYILILIPILFVIGIVVAAGIYNHYRNKENPKNEIKEKKNKKNKKICIPFSGGGFNILFNTDGGEEIPSMHVGIAVSPDSYEDLPTPTKEGFTFDGWYYDKELSNKVEVTNSKDITPVPDKNKDDCVIGFKDIEMFAKWNEVQLRVEEQTIENNSEEPVSDTTPPETITPETPTTTIYKPINYGFLMSRYGKYNNRNILRYSKFKMFASVGPIYPINDGTFLGLGRDNLYDYVLYKTTINENNYYVLYYSYFIMNKQRDFNANRTISYSEPLVILTNNAHKNIDVSGTFYVKMSPAVHDSDINYEIANYGRIYVEMIQNRIPDVNTNIFFNYNEGEMFNER